MDILSHTLSGVAVGALIANQVNGSFSKKAGLIALGGIAGAFPDVDAISMWSGFDGTFGKWFNLVIPGREIFSAQLWYSHHAFFHSLLAALLFSTLIGLGIYFKNYLKITATTTREKIYYTLPYMLVFMGGFLIHIFQDMPTPGGSWGGVAFWWPSANYSGGTGSTWWWNNYDVFLIIFSTVCINIALLFLKSKHRNIARISSILIFVFAISISISQFNKRGFDFSYYKNGTPYPLCEEKSKEIQQEILGDKLYKAMRWLDKKIPVAF
ncbi:metal-dependent hydrolase [Labilibacter marinus]|uniref:metal-dependent hydrolase n=1 Tax=Labilibacter marinus TaxID=1477105 RepID=UPI00094FF557|nr:metal-dependent hydrolase [Labilibacter marinus]